MSDIFYSQVNNHLAKELYARGRSGIVSRTTKQIDQMVGNIANVELSAYEGAFTGEPILSLGGKRLQTKEYLPSGYLGTDSEAFRIPPVITGVMVKLADSAQFAINTAIITIIISDPTDLNLIERHLCKPGRGVKLLVSHPDSAILSDDPKLNESELLAQTRILKEEQKDNQDINTDDFLYMNKLLFTGIVSNFKQTYNTDATVELVLTVRAMAGSFPDASMYISNSDIPSTSIDTERDTSQTFYSKISNEVNKIITPPVYAKDFIKGVVSQVDEELIVEDITDQSIINGALEGNTDRRRFITLGLLIRYVNEIILKPIKEKADSLFTQILDIQCSDTICKSNYYENIVSADPSRILLWRGTTESPTSTYGNGENPKKAYPNVDPVTDGYQEKFAFAGPPVAYPSRIYIALDVIKEIESDLISNKSANSTGYTIKQFLNKISAEIEFQTGRAIDMALIQSPEVENVLLYYDTNYLGGDKVEPEFVVPVFSSLRDGTIVRDFKLGFELPDAMKTSLFGFASIQADPSKLTSFNPWLFSNTKELQEQANEDFENTHKNALIELAKAKSDLGKNFTVPRDIKNLQAALIKYIAFPMPNIKESNDINKPLWTFDLEFTIDGVNGFRYGDVLLFKGLPERYNEQWVFCIKQITHDINNHGEWTTNISCFARARITEIT